MLLERLWAANALSKPIFEHLLLLQHSLYLYLHRYTSREALRTYLYLESPRVSIDMRAKMRL